MIFLFEYSSTFWIIFALILLAAELIIPGILLLFFGMGALLVALISFFHVPPLWIQWLIFSISSVIFLLLFRNKFKKMLKKEAIETITQSTIQIEGQKVKVISNITSQKSGLVEVDGSIWKAYSETDETLEENAIVEIVKRDKLTLYVKKL